MNKFSFRQNKRCPRCNTKTPSTSVICPGCQLNYQKFESATNKEAKQNLRMGEKEQVLMRKGRPLDVKFWKLLLISVFLGFMGGHHYYVGRYKMAIFYTCFFIVGAINAVLTSFIKTTLSGLVYEIFTLLVLTWGFVVLMWIVDVAKICVNKYKIPVSRLG